MAPERQDALDTNPYPARLFSPSESASFEEDPSIKVSRTMEIRPGMFLRSRTEEEVLYRVVAIGTAIMDSYDDDPELPERSPAVKAVGVGSGPETEYIMFFDADDCPLENSYEVVSAEN